ncbi:MAG: hypothetical protein K0R38_3364 [Polyangiaceae bacterium]|jgi:hypothetical protein|nr:hypothetical protein [Polyangiaceae bacterium]
MQALNRRELLTALGACGVATLSPRVLAAGEPIAVVVSSGSRQRHLSLDKLRRIFLALPTDDDDGRRFVPINLAPSANGRARFDQAVLKLRPEEAARYWIDQRLRGSKPPRVASSYEICRGAVQELPGAISYLPLSQAGSLRALAIDGRTPNDAGYILR